MKTRIGWIGITVVILAILLSACGGGGAVDVEPDVSEAPVVSEEQPTLDMADLDAAYQIFLADMEQYNTISPEELDTLLGLASPFILDLRNADEVEDMGHIAGAVRIHFRDLMQNIAYLPSFDTQIISYGMTIKRCSVALTILEALGWKDVKCLKEIGETRSFSAWVDQGYDVVEGAPPAGEMLNAANVDEAMRVHFDALLSNLPEKWGYKSKELNTLVADTPDLLLIDVRTQDEADKRGSIDAPNVVLIPLEQIIDLKASWPAGKDAKIVTYDRRGHRSIIAMIILRSYGYTEVLPLTDGYTTWKDAGFPVTK